MRLLLVDYFCMTERTIFGGIDSLYVSVARVAIKAGILRSGTNIENRAHKGALVRIQSVVGSVNYHKISDCWRLKIVSTVSMCGRGEWGKDVHAPVKHEYEFFSFDTFQNKKKTIP